MALIDKASLLMVPSTYEAGTLYNVLPSGNRAPDSTDQNSGYDQTRADFTFDRGTDHGATRIGSDGLIKKYRENLLLQSNQFDTTWTQQSVALTSGQSGYDGSNNAWLITKSGANGQVNQTLSTNGVNTFSCYAKAGTSNWLRLTPYDDVFFDLSTGVSYEYGSTTIDSAIESIGSGWYRCSITYNATSTLVRIIVADSSSSSSGTSGSIYIQNAQLESSMVATDYLDSGATTAKAGVLIDLPRINYDANGENGSLLLEPSRANFIPYSEYFSDWALDGDGAGQSVTANYSTSPEGVQNAYRLQLNKTGGTYSRIRKSVTSSYSGAGIFSVYLKTNDGSTKTLSMRWGGSGSVEKTITGEWQRFDVQGTATNGLAADCEIFLDAANSDVVDLSVYGAQLEAGSYATSYIPNHGESGGVTRAADTCSVTGVSDVIGGTSGTIFFDVTMSESLTNSNYKQFFYYTDSGSNQTYMYVSNTNYIVGNPNLGNITSTTQLQAGERYKIAVTYATNSFKMYINGSEDATSSSGAPKDNENIISIGSYNGASEFNEFTFNQYAHFQEALSDSELATLTTL